MRRFVLLRDEDVSGVSGTGVVVEGIEWEPGGVATIRWIGEWGTYTHHPRGIAGVERIHGHDGRTKVVWLDHEHIPFADDVT